MFLDQTHLTIYFRVDGEFWPLYQSEVVDRVRSNPRASTYLHQVGGDRLFLDVDGPVDPRTVAREALSIVGMERSFAYATNSTSGRSHVVIDRLCDADERARITRELAARFPVDLCDSLRLPFSRKRAYQPHKGIYDHIYNENGDEIVGIDALHKISTYRCL